MTTREEIHRLMLAAKIPDRYVWDEMSPSLGPYTKVTQWGVEQPQGWRMILREKNPTDPTKVVNGTLVLEVDREPTLEVLQVRIDSTVQAMDSLKVELECAK